MLDMVYTSKWKFVELAWKCIEYVTLWKELGDVDL